MKKKRFVEYLDDIKFNIILSIIALIISWIIGISSYVSPSSNHGALIPYIFPPFFFICTLLVYFISRLFIKKYNWILTILGMIVNLFFAIEWYLTNNI